MAERIDDIAVQEFVNAIKEEPQDTNKTYNATVSRVDKEGIVWVNIHGSDKETPTASTSTEVKRGDNVVVNWRNNKLYIGGNYTNPSAGIGTVQPSIDYVTDLIANSITTNSIYAATGYIEDLTSKNITTENLAADHATIKELDVESMAAATAYIRDLTSENITADDIIADHATIDTLDSTYATIEELHSDYAEIDLANVNNAWIEYGAMKKAEVFDENVFDLSGNHATLSRIDASKINVANLRADNLVVRRINGQPVVGGYTLIDSNSSGYASKNPQALGWYEFVNAQWVLSTDTTVDLTKAYYQTGNEVSLYDQAYIDGLEDDLQQQIDGAVETFTGSVVPTLVNWPYTDWYDTSVTPVHDERAKHVGDIYYVVNSASDENGYCYRFAYDNTTHAYSWVLIKDSDVTKALSDISDLQTFESTTTSWMDETDEGLETIRTNHTALAGVVDKTVKDSVQLWFTKANTTAPNKPTAEVTSTSTAGNAWRKVVPAYNASYPNYYYCWQYKFVDDTFGWSDVVRDIAMGETQGVSRDAKNTADAALPASTFESFESTTFTDLVDEVDEQSTTMTNMTARLGLNSDGTGANTDIVAKESALEQTVDGISTRVGRTETKLNGTYAVSSTTAGTATKVATIKPTLADSTQWVLTSGTVVTVKFTQANTAESPSLNVNNKGAYPIAMYNGSAITTTAAQWKAGSTMTFVFDDGATKRWLLQDATMLVRVKNAETSIDQTADSIVSLASNNETYTKPDGTTATNAIKSSITQTANSIESVVANNDTYTAPDGTTKTNAIKSAIKQNANDISLRVEKSGVIAAINASVEEEGGSAVKINANKVNITGTAIFNAVDADANAKAAMLNSELEIGGRNLAPMSHWFGGTGRSVYNENIVDTYSTTARGFALCHTSDILSPLVPSSAGLGEDIVVSFDFKIDSGGDASHTIMFYAYQQNGISINITNYTSDIGVLTSDEKKTTWTRVKRATKARNFGDNGSYSIGSIYLYDNTGNNNFSVRNVKIERGNKATDWTPDPEDVQDKIDAKKSTFTINATGTDASKPYATILVWAAEGQQLTFAVDSTAGIKAGDTVRIKITVSDMSNAPVYIVTTCRETPTSNTSIKTTSHGLDTTIIDGGNIITNSIGANQIDANSINASNSLTVGAFTSSTQNDVLNSNMQIGGRNLCKNTGFNDLSMWFGSPSVSNGKLTITTATEVGISADYRTSYTIPAGTSYTVSCYFYENTIADGNRRIYFIDQPAWDYWTVPANFTGLFSRTSTASQDLTRLTVEYDTRNATSGKWVVGPVKIELGNKATDWTPALEDIGEVKYVDSSYSQSYDTLLRWAGLAEDHYTVSPSTSGLSVGDIVYIRVTCTTTNSDMYVQARVTVIESTTRITATPIGLVDKAGYASRVATDNITTIDSSGIWVTPSGLKPTNTSTGAGATGTRINSSGMQIFKGGTSVAEYGDTARVGPVANGYARTLINTGGMQVVQRSSSGTDITMANIGYGSGNAESGTNTTPYYTLGTRKSGVAVGNYSLAAGVENEAVKYSSATIGEGLVSTNNDQTVVGRYNDRLLGVNSLFVVGDGTSDSNRSTAFEVEIGGDVIAKGGITVEGHSSAIGATTSSYLTSSKAITAGTATYLCSISLTAGTWVITGVVQFPNASDTTYRRMKIKAGSSSSAEPPDVQVAALNGTPTTITATIIEYVSSNTTYYLNVMAGKACTMAAGGLGNYNYMKAVRIA